MKENIGSGIDRGMNRFTDYLVRRLPLIEVTELFPTGKMNDLFVRELLRVLPAVQGTQLGDDLARLVGMNFVGYIDKSLRSAGFDDAERDGLVHDLVVKLLVSPGGLVSGWKMDAPLSSRFKRSVKNAIITLGQKQSRRRKRMRDLPDDQIQREKPQSEEDLVHDFRVWLRQRHGEPAVTVFDARLNGKDIKNLIGQDGIPSAYALKLIVSQIKSAAVLWAGTDPVFQLKVRRLMDAESQTLAKRFGRERVGVG